MGVELLSELRDSDYIREKYLGDNISSFNFRREVFYKGLWDNTTVKARGLFINTNTNEIVARSYNKFFNIGEIEGSRLNDLVDKFNYPVNWYLKYNGFLGIIGFNSEKDELFISTKSVNDGDHVNIFKSIIQSSLSEESLSYLKEYTKNENVSLIFEVIDPFNDPHIIDYEEPFIILLDVVKRSVEYEKLDFEEVLRLSEKLEISCKDLIRVSSNKEEFIKDYEDLVNSEEAKKSEIEGFVLEDSSDYMVKVKLHYYSFWKSLRSLAHRYASEKPVDNHYSIIKYGNKAKNFLGWLKGKDKDYLLANANNILRLRKDFLKDTS